MVKVATAKMTHILFVCTHNRCRSILCEAIARQDLPDRFRVSSAGSAPAGKIYPQTLVALEAAGFETTNLRSKSWSEFEAAPPDLIITVCDSAAGEACPLSFKGIKTEHWGLPDPSKVEDQAEQKALFETVIERIKAQVPAWEQRLTGQ